MNPTVRCAGTENIAEAVSILKNGGVLLVPTETVYGLVCDAASESGIAKIYEMKHRPSSKLLTSFVDSAETMLAALPPQPAMVASFVHAFCPGPITLVVPDGDVYSGYRIPDHPWLLELLKRYKRPLASTSANLSGQPPAHTVEEALQSLAEMPDLVIDNGPIDASSKPSTVVQIFADGTWKILRPGPISADMLEHALSAC